MSGGGAGEAGAGPPQDRAAGEASSARAAAAPDHGGDPRPRRWVTHGEAETEDLGAALAAELAPDGVLLLSGELGSGKTVLARGVARALGIDPRQVLSPTFNLIREHRGAGGGLLHVDLYRLEPEETAALGLDEQLAAPGVKVVEWAERLLLSPSPLLPSAAGAPSASVPAVPVLALALRRLPAAGAEAREIVELPLEPNANSMRERNRHEDP